MSQGSVHMFDEQIILEMIELRAKRQRSGCMSRSVPPQQAARSSSSPAAAATPTTTPAPQRTSSGRSMLPVETPAAALPGSTQKRQRTIAGFFAPAGAQKCSH